MPVTRLTRAALVVVSLLGAGGALAEPLTYTGQVAHVSDADTVRVVVRDTCAEAACPSVGESLRVRLAEIDAPESDQPYGDEAAAALVDRIDGSMLQIVQTDTDQYGRVVAQLVHQDVWINGWLVGEGHAWVYPQYAESPELFEWQSEAREAQRGLWAADDPVEPWLWRRQ